MVMEPYVTFKSFAILHIAVSVVAYRLLDNYESCILGQTDANRERTSTTGRRCTCALLPRATNQSAITLYRTAMPRTLRLSLMWPK